MTTSPPTSESSEAALAAALAAASNDHEHPLRLEGGVCDISVPLPAGLIEGLDQLVITVKLSGDIISLSSPLASLTTPMVPSDVATALLRRQFFPTQTEGASFALADREDVLIALYHWMPPAITPDGFADIFGRFVSSALLLRGEVTHMVGNGAPFAMLSSSG